MINEICKQAVCERKLFLRSSGADMRDFISISTFSKIILDESGKFYRYNFFFANYLIKKTEWKRPGQLLI